MKRSLKKGPFWKSRNEALKMENLLGAEVQADGYEQTLGTTFQDMCEYIEHCLDFEDNPLRHLRQYFPDFEFTFHDPENKEDVVGIVKNVDFVVPDSISTPDWSMGFYTLTRKNTKDRKKVCFCPVNVWRQPELGIWPYEELEEVNAQILINDPDGKIDKGFELLLLNCKEARDHYQRYLRSINLI